MKTLFLNFFLLFFMISGCVKKNASTEMTMCAPKVNDKEWYTSNLKAPLFEGLEGIAFVITTQNSEVQRYFNQGLMLVYGFNHAEAARSFYEATRLDPNCAMAFWGYAYVLGPNYNAGMEDDNYERAFHAVAQAQKLSKNTTPKEISLIKALAARYSEKPPADRASLDMAYAAEMKKVYAQFPSDPDIGALFAESLMNLHPWDLFDKETKVAKAWTPEIIDILEGLIQAHPKHPGAHHMYIHAMESSANPEKALPSANLLDFLVPGSGHLVHMPSHIYINTGDYYLGTLSNLRAVKVDSVYTSACHAQGAYPLAYYPHNYHFLTATAALGGMSKLSWNSAKVLQKNTQKDIMREPDWGTLQHFYTIPFYIAVKFSLWDEMFAIPQPENDLVYPSVIWHYATGMAHLGKGDVANAQKELDKLKLLLTHNSKMLEDMSIWGMNTMIDLVQIASKVLEGEIAAKRNRLDASIALLKEAIVIEDQLNYNEPPDWFFSVRHNLGAILIKAGKYADAESVYREDLETWKKNGWALIGLHHALKNQSKDEEAAVVKTAFDEAWKHADIEINSSSSMGH